MGKYWASFILTGLLLQGAATAADTGNLLPLDPNVIQGRLDNGLRYIIRNNGKPENRVELRLVVNAGSVLEEEDQRGLAHFLEHMAFNGTKHFAKQELVDYLESIGMAFGPDLNAYTSFDETVYKLQVPTDDTAILDQAFLILQDWAQGVLNQSEEIEAERGVVIEEWRGRRGARQRIRDKQFPVIFHDSQYANRLPIGTKEVLDNFDHDRLRALYRDWYRPDLMAFIAVGDVPVEQLEARIRETFGTLTNPGDPRPRPIFEVPDHEETLVSTVSDPEATSSDVNVYYKRDKADLRTRSDYRRYLMEDLFNAMLNERLAELRKKADPPFLNAYSFKGGFVRTKDVFGLGATVPDNGFIRGLESVFTEAERVRRHGFTAGELERAKIQSMRGMEVAYNERDTTESSRYATEYVSDFTRDTISPGVEEELRLHQELLPAIAIEEIDQLARDWITENNRVILASGPEKDEITMPTEAELLALFGRVEAAEIAPYVDDTAAGPLLENPPTPGQIVERAEIEPLGLTLWTLSNGIRLILKPTDFKADEILFSGFSPGGSSMANLGEFIPASTAASAMMESGLGSFSQVQLTKKLAGKVVAVSPYIQELEEGLAGQCAPQDLETLFQLTHLWFTAPRADEEAFASFQERLRAQLQNRLANPAAVFRDAMTEILSQNHPRRKPWTPNTVDDMDLAESLETFRERFADADDFTFLLVGSFDLEKLAPLVETYLASLPVLPSEEAWRDHSIRQPLGWVEKDVRKGLEPKSRVAMQFHGPIEWTFKQRFAVQTMLAALNIRLRERLREEMGGTYSVGAYPTLNQFPEPHYTIHVVFGCAPEQVDNLIAGVREEIEALKNEPLDPIYLTKVKEGQLRKREIALEKNGFWQGVLKFYYWNGEDPLQLLEFESMVNATDAAGIQATAQKYFGTENQAVFRLFPEEVVATP